VQGQLLGVVGVRADELRAQRGTLTKYGHVLGSVARGFIIGGQSVVEPAFRRGFVPGFDVFLRAFRVVHHSGCRRMRRGWSCRRLRAHGSAEQRQ
jgi:hypothetical protein